MHATLRRLFVLPDESTARDSALDQSDGAGVNWKPGEHSVKGLTGDPDAVEQCALTQDSEEMTQLCDIDG